ncbi:MAG: S41 family peptidase [Microgenomates group bacterium]|nr:S41 family peptidase [Microgenomates group bacterium]
MKTKFNAKKLTDILVWLAIAVFLFSAGFKLGESKNRLNQNQPGSFKTTNLLQENSRNLDFNLFWQAWETLEKKYVDESKLNPQKMYYGAIKGMVAALEDPYTFFLTPEENKQTKADLEGKFEGIGAQLGLKDNRVVIIAPLKNSPAEKAGVKAGDFINKVDGQSTKNWSLSTAVSKIRGPKGSKVKLTLERNEKNFEVEIVREVIKIDSVELSYETKPDCQTACEKIAVLKINQFGDTTNDEWDMKVEEILNRWQSHTIKGLILDLRDNPGGYLESSVYIASEFLPRNRLVVKQESTVENPREYRVERNGRLIDIPLVVLVNKGSASAAEILAGALRDYRRATLVGEKTFGKGSVQEALDLAGGAGIHVTVAKWILPKGDWINSQGITPEIVVENRVSEGNTLTKEDDNQLKKGLEILLK